MKIRFIGDVHGKFDRYKKLIAEVDHSRQVGDFGVGFFRYDKYEGGKIPLSNPPYDQIMRGDHKFIRGNHDNPAVCAQQKYWIPDGTIEIINGTKILYIGGALSVDREWRTEGLDWWADEELSHFKLQCFADLYQVEKPDVVVTHDCPEFVALEMERASGRRKLDINSITRQAFQIMHEIHQPKLWIFGHWHYDFNQVLKGTRFICLNELSFIDIEFAEETPKIPLDR